VTRFPPEPSGYLHIGHVKAAMLNYHYAKMYEGKMILRFDDTNPMNEKIEFVDNIIRDLGTLEIKPDRVTYTSDYFDKTKECMEQLIKLGLAYADDTPSEEMKLQRDKGVESKYRTATVEENMKRFHLMLEGKHDEEVPKAATPFTKEEKKKEAPKEEKKAEEPVAQVVTSDWCMRAKLDMQCPVKCLRDPVFYRIKREPHHRTGTKYKAYPTYDFACPIVDAVEDVTHCLRTIEYHDRNALYDWVQEKLGLRKVTLYDYSRLNLVSTILSKRSLKWFVEAGVADGWYDPRFPTVQGIMRRGLTVEALKNFMLEQGPSKNTNLMEWDKLWAMNKDIIDPTTPRYTAIVKSSACHLYVENGPATPEARSQPLHPKNDSVGSKAVIYGRDLWIERDDAASIEVGEKVTLMKWGNVTITKKENGQDGNPVLYGTIDESDKDFKKTKKITWVCADPDTTVEITLTEFDHLITKKKVEDNDDVKQLVNHNSKIEYSAIAEGSLRSIQRGVSLQLERRGFFFVDQAATVGDRKIKLNFIPDGKSKSMSVISHKLDAKEIAGGKGKAEGANRAEAKKLAGAAGEEVKAAEGEEGAPLSKKQAKKDAKKAEKAEKKAGGKAGGEEGEAAAGAKKKPAQANKGGQLLKIYNWRVGNSWVDIACIAANFAGV